MGLSSKRTYNLGLPGAAHCCQQKQSNTQQFNTQP
jgi:hypothetical protein